jgi:glycosyltransferase involved in cell wall biosynthesis
VYQLRQRTQALPEPAATLLVSVAAGQALTLLGPGGPVTTWVVEQGEDLHWLEPPVDVARRTDRWLAGSDGTAAELALRLGERGLDGASTIDVVPEFIDPVSPDPVAVSRRRRELCDRSSLVVGAGIGTHRKGPDLFLEAALDSHRRRPGRCRFVWIGGETDPLVPALRDEVGRLRMGHVIHFEPSVSDIDTCVAAADALLHTARLDAFPLICLHAAAAGTPVVAFSGTGGVEEMFGGGFVGAPFPDITMLTARLHEVLDDPAPVVAAQQRRVEERYVTPVAAPAVCEHLLRSASVGGTP